LQKINGDIKLGN